MEMFEIESELDYSVDSAAEWLEDFLERIDLDEDDYIGIENIIADLREASEFIRSELGIGGETEDDEDEEYDDPEDDDPEDDYDPHSPSILELEDEDEEKLTFVGTWDTFRFLEDEDGEVVGIQVDFVK